MTPRLIAGLIGAGIILAGATGLYWKGRLEGAARERPKMEAALAKARGAKLEVRGAHESAERVDEAVRARDAAARSVVQVIREAQKSEDANAPLPASRLARLRAHDQQLCDSAQLAGCAPAPDAAGSKAALRAASSAGTGHRR